MTSVVQQLVLITLAFITCSLAEEKSTCSSEGCDDHDEQSAVALSMSVSLAASKRSFGTYIHEFGRKYSEGSEEFKMRHAIFKHRLQQIHSHNKNAHKRWTAAVNHLSDRTSDELAQLRGLRPLKAGKRGSGVVGAHTGNFLDQIQSSTIEDEKSWSHLTAVSTNVDQSACGSCWAVATATVLRANAEINGYNRTFSAQELVDCVPNPHHCGGTGGCAGSTVELAFNWVMEQGLDTLEGTPYLAQDTTCKKTASPLLLSTDGSHQPANLDDMIAVGLHASAPSSGGMAIGLTGWTRLPENEYQPLLQAVATVGPVAISAAARAWHSYHLGIFDGCKRDAVIDHAVTIVGYGKDGDVKYWTIKNSWGNEWGEQGNIRMLRHDGAEQHCGTDKQPEVGTACDGGPSEVHVCGMCGILYDSVVPHFQKSI